MNKLLERLGTVPLSTKIAVIALAAVMLTGANWYFFVSEADAKTDSAKSEARQLEEELIKKRIIADNLAQYRRDKESLERRLADALAELPAEADLDDLLRQLSDVGKRSGLEIVTLEPGVETPQTFYASIPIRMQVAGNFHEIAVFFESVSKLRRIVNISGISFSEPKRMNEKVVLKASYLATTFRFLDPSEQAQLAPKKGKK